MNTSWNWLQGDDQQQDGPSRGQAVPVFAGQKLVVVGGSSGMGRQTAADVVAAGGSAVIIGQDPRQGRRHRRRRWPRTARPTASPPT